MRKHSKKEPSLPFHSCAAGDCAEPGEYKAPKSRYQTGQYQYLCLTHIREFNQAWDYFDGWSREEIESFMHDASFGHRPTWKISSQPVFTDDKLRESFYKMLGETPPGDTKIRGPRVPAKVREAFAVLGLETDAQLIVIKSQYKKLVKKYHPDVNRDNKEAEEMFKRITAAYTLLFKTYGTPDET